MGEQKYLKRVEELFDKSPVVFFNSIKRITQEKKKTNYAKLLISNLIKKGKVKKIAKGVYTKHNELALAVFGFEPAYLGLQSSLSAHNLWEQETIPVVLTTRKARRGIRSASGGNILVRNINKRYFFGFDPKLDGNFYLPYSNIEKTFIDMFYFKEKIDKNAFEEFKKRIDEKKLKIYLKNYPRKFREKVIFQFKKEAKNEKDR